MATAADIYTRLGLFIDDWNVYLDEQIEWLSGNSYENDPTPPDDDINNAGKRYVTDSAGNKKLVWTPDSLMSIADNFEGNINDLDARVTVTEADIASLKPRMTTAENEITALKPRVTTAENDINSLESRTTATEGDIANLEVVKAGMTQADFEANRTIVNEEMAASGFVVREIMKVVQA